jgi:hypothetical protein
MTPTGRPASSSVYAAEDEAAVREHAVSRVTGLMDPSTGE